VSSRDGGRGITRSSDKMAGFSKVCEGGAGPVGRRLNCSEVRPLASRAASACACSGGAGRIRYMEAGLRVTGTDEPGQQRDVNGIRVASRMPPTPSHLGTCSASGSRDELVRSDGFMISHQPPVPCLILASVLLFVVHSQTGPASSGSRINCCM
jgi:hypothetical protein